MFLFYFISVPRKLFGGYRITPKQCRATKTLPSTDPRASGPTICMFNHECAQRNGEVVGACMDGFLFGACCQVPKTQHLENTLINDAQNAYYHQYQQNKLQQQESETNSIVSQAYENFAENSAQAQSQSQENPAYGAENISQENPAYGAENISQDVHTNGESQQLQDISEQTSNLNADTSTENTQTSASIETESSAQSSTETQSNVSREPPKISVTNEAVMSSSATSPQAPQNDDFVLQALNTLPPEDEVSNDQMSFTTEIPSKIVNNLTEQLSSESESFEESHASAATEPNVDVNEDSKHHEDTQTQNTDTVFNTVTFSHSGITHPGADSVVIENDLQFSTGYGPQPVFVPAPEKPYETEADSKKPSSFYEQSSKQPSNVYDSTTTSSSITTHVDSIETIIQQLNNSSHGPTYNVISPQSSTYAYEMLNATNTPALDYNQEQSTVFNEYEQNEKQTSTPLYGTAMEESSSTTTTNGQYADELVLEDHTMPQSNYNDQQPSAHPTSDFNKMPVMGIAYPVDMSHMEDYTTAIDDVDRNVQSIYTNHNNDQQQGSNTDIQQAQTSQHIQTTKPHPMATYIGVVTSQSYGQPQVPHEVVVSSHTTKVEGNLDSSVEYRPITMTTNKITTAIYQPTTTKPVKTTTRPNLVTKRPATKRPVIKTSTHKISTGTSSYSTTPIETKTPTTSDAQYQPNQNYNPSSSSYYQETYHSGSTPKPVATRRPTKKQTAKPVFTSYVTGPTSPRPTSSVDFSYDSQHQVIATDDKLDSFVHSTAESLASAANNQESPIYGNAAVINTDTPVPILRPQPSQYNTHKKPGFVQKPATQRPPAPTVLITPKPTRLNTVPSSSSYSVVQQTTPTVQLSDYASTSNLYNSPVTRRPGFDENAVGGDYVGITTVNSNDFDDPGYYGTPDRIRPPQPLPGVFTQSSTEQVYPVPSDDKPAFPGYYGPTPTYPAFPVPGEKIGSQPEEETYTSPNDFVNFPPVRNPNLNMSAASSAVTSDLELSTPAFVEDTILKNKMNTLVHKIVESLQGNFEALADIIDDSNNTAPVLTYQASSTAATASAGTKKPVTRKPVKATTAKPKTTTKKPATRLTTKAPTKKTATTRKPEVTTRKPVNRRTTTTTRRPTTRKPTRKVTTTTKAPSEDELVDEEDEEDINPSDNEIPEEDEAQSGVGAGGRKIRKLIVNFKEKFKMNL